MLLAFGVFGFSIYVWSNLRSAGFQTNIPLAPALVAALALIPILRTWGRYQQSHRTTPSDEVLARLLRSDEEYCLLLRPFGSDGETILRRGRGSFTLEQVIGRAAGKILGFKVYAMVDQDRRLAPPGLVHMRAPHDQWQSAVQALIRRAHSIVLVLPPGEDVRHSFNWELAQITHHHLQSRVILVLPPPDQDKAGYARSLQQACVILGMFEPFAGTADDVDSLSIYHWETTLSSRTIMLKFAQLPDATLGDVQCWEAPETRVRRIRYKSYQRALEEALALNQRELSGLGFSARYPDR